MSCPFHNSNSHSQVVVNPHTRPPHQISTMPTDDTVESIPSKCPFSASEAQKSNQKHSFKQLESKLQELEEAGIDSKQMIDHFKSLGSFDFDQFMKMSQSALSTIQELKNQSKTSSSGCPVFSGNVSSVNAPVGHHLSKNPNVSTASSGICPFSNGDSSGTSSKTAHPSTKAKPSGSCPFTARSAPSSGRSPCDTDIKLSKFLTPLNEAKDDCNVLEIAFLGLPDHGNVKAFDMICECSTIVDYNFDDSDDEIAFRIGECGFHLYSFACDSSDIENALESYDSGTSIDDSPSVEFKFIESIVWFVDLASNLEELSKSAKVLKMALSDFLPKTPITIFANESDPINKQSLSTVNSVFEPILDQSVSIHKVRSHSGGGLPIALLYTFSAIIGNK